MYSIGIDAGSVATKGVLFNGNIVDSIIIPTGWSPKGASLKILDKLIERNKISRDDIKHIIGTGYGRISMGFVDKTITEISCHAKGAYHLNSNIRTILDIGGQDSKVISLDDKGNVINFVMNDKCAAGTGKFLEVTLNNLGIDVRDIDNYAKGSKPADISSMCTVFAESEIVSLLAVGKKKEEIASGVLYSIANKSYSLLNRINIKDNIAFTGGVASSKELKNILETKLKKKIYTSSNTQIVGALGAAVIGFNLK
ncbi:2-hydroxyglutaryl-CoA dehydratase [Clostridium sp. D2Q-11]|uniref:2-hydroxyglutaryl-CoA dehydratase n=1 Tax=Anaeromonas frigoriresistens TaxID=2683708 RepID=A0A942UWM4_9FIRM|nr:acyl-CoA dehydratase activase [Anaeromonas frigoriresistens]MBS4538174.1 2-hydroxyglutaryl-CoA dehydratase [Anaeromonas frigoriresistens]